MINLSTDEDRYLLAAFSASPREWFRPGTVGADDYSTRQLQAIVTSLAHHGFLDAEPDCHARLTDRGRKHASKAHGRATHHRVNLSRRQLAMIISSFAAFFLSAIVLMRFARIF